MNFLNPWVALGLAAIVIPLLVLLYFLKLRRREEVVPSTLLWKRAVQDLQVNAPFQRLRRNLLLLLQLLILAAALLALARPIIQTEAADQGRLVILIDRSASMNSREGDQTRLDLAKEQATRLVKTLNRRSRSWWSFLDFGGAEAKTKAMIIAFADRATVVAPFTPNPGELIDAIERIEPTDGRTNMREALDLAEAYMSPPTRITQQMEDATGGVNATPISAEPAAKVILISDGGIHNLEDVVLAEGQIELIKVGAAQQNIGITALRTQRNYERPEVLDAFLQVQNFGPDPVTIDVSFLIDGELANTRVRTITLAGAPQRDAAGGGPPPEEVAAPMSSTQSLSFELTLDRGAVVEARLSGEDVLPVDNRAFAVVPPPRRLRVLVVTERNFFLDSVLRGLPLAERVFMPPAQYESSAGGLAADGGSPYDVVIFDKHAPESLPPGNYMFLGAAPPEEAIQVEGELADSHALIWWDETHPILRHVALDFVYVAKSLNLTVPAEAEVLVEGPRGPAVVRYLNQGRHYLIVNFAIEASNWWQKPGFPVFMYNALRYLGAGGAAGDQDAFQPGDTLRIQLPDGVESARLEKPQGPAQVLRPDATGTIYYGGTEHVGIYALRYDAGEREQIQRYAVNLADQWESDIVPRGAADLASPQIVAGQTIETATPEIWRWFIGVGLLLVLVEWYIYNRRVMI